MKEEYKECPNCHNMTDKTDKECPYCLYSFWFTNSTPQNNIPNSLKRFVPIIPWLAWDWIHQWETWWKYTEKKEIIKRLRIFLIIFIIITCLIPTLIGLFLSTFWE